MAMFESYGSSSESDDNSESNGSPKSRFYLRGLIGLQKQWPTAMYHIQVNCCEFFSGMARFNSMDWFKSYHLKSDD